MFLTGIDRQENPVRAARGRGGASRAAVAGAASRRWPSGGGSVRSVGGQQKKKGQKQRYEKAEEKSKRFMDLNKDKIDIGARRRHRRQGTARRWQLEGSEDDQAQGRRRTTSTATCMSRATCTSEARTSSRPGRHGHRASQRRAPSDATIRPQYVRGRRSAHRRAASCLRASRVHAGKIRVEPTATSSSTAIFAVTGNLTVNGVVRAKGFETI